jgi:hypothetical protein
MLAKDDEVRNLVKRLIKLRLAETVGVQNITFAGEDIEVAKVEDGPMRFNLPRLKKSYVVMSGRVYEREYMDDGIIKMAVSDQQASTMTQLNYKGEPEEVDTTVFSNRLVCSCGGVRYIKNADVFQVTKCKVCTIKDRNSRRHKRGA